MCSTPATVIYCTMTQQKPSVENVPTPWYSTLCHHDTTKLKWGECADSLLLYSMALIHYKTQVGRVCSSLRTVFYVTITQQNPILECVPAAWHCIMWHHDTTKRIVGSVPTPCYCSVWYHDTTKSKCGVCAYPPYCTL